MDLCIKSWNAAKPKLWGTVECSDQSEGLQSERRGSVCTVDGCEAQPLIGDLGLPDGGTVDGCTPRVVLGTQEIVHFYQKFWDFQNLWVVC